MREDKRVANALESIAKSLGELVKETKASRKLKERALENEFVEVITSLEGLKENYFGSDNSEGDKDNGQNINY